MKVEEVSIDEIIPYERNARVHDETQIDRIANSIAEFGFNQPIVIDENNIVIVGHGRLLAAKKIGRKTAPVVRLPELTEGQKKAYRILDNKLQNDSVWDFESLIPELGTLEELGINLESWGLEELLENQKIDVIDDEFDGESCENKETFIKLGDVITLGDHRVICGDSTDSAITSKLLEEVRPDLMVTDPPYGVNYDPTWREDYDGNLGTRATGKVTNDNRSSWAEAYKNFDAPVLYLWHIAQRAKDTGQELEELGYELIAQIIWNKPIFVFGRGDYHWKHEPCWYAVKKGHKHNWAGDRSQSTVWDIANNSAYSQEKEERSGHSTQKPMECMARPIRNNSSPGDLVCDPFLGSGTTLIAAEQLGRICYGCEIEPVYCEMIIQRYKAHCEKNNKAFACEVNGKPYNPI